MPPVTSVTVYSGQARVVRSGSLAVSGSQRVTFPRLPRSVDTDSIRVEAEGAEVSHVDVRTVKDESFSHDEAKKLLSRMEELDTSLTRITAERGVHHTQLEALRRVRPSVQSDSDAARAQTAPAAWNAAVSFLMDTAALLEARIRELDTQSEALKRERQQHADRAATLSKTFSEPGVEVTATLTGSGTTKVVLTYLTTGARWYPRYELQLQPEAQRVQMAFYGRVSQETGEDWEGARLTLSTAVPTNATELPKLSTWKLGARERFIPTPRAHVESTRSIPSAPSPRPPATLNADGKVAVTLVRTEPAAQPEEGTGRLQWDVVVPASGKSTVSFQYTLSRPKGWRLYQH